MIKTAKLYSTTKEKKRIFSLLNCKGLENQIGNRKKKEIFPSFSKLVSLILQFSFSHTDMETSKLYVEISLQKERTIALDKNGDKLCQWHMGRHLT